MEPGGEPIINEFVPPDFVPSSSDSSPAPSDDGQENQAPPPPNVDALRVPEERQKKRKMEVAFGMHTDLQMRSLYPNMAPPPLKKPNNVDVMADASPLPFADTNSMKQAPTHPSRRRSVLGNNKLLLDLQQQALNQGDQMKLLELQKAEQAHHNSLALSRQTATTNNDSWSSSCTTPSGQKMNLMRQPDYGQRPVCQDQPEQAAIESSQRRDQIIKEAAKFASEKKDASEKKKKERLPRKMLEESDDSAEFFTKMLTRIDNGVSGVKKHVTERLKEHMGTLAGDVVQQVVNTVGRQVSSDRESINNLTGGVQGMAMQLNQMELDMVVLKQDVAEIKDVLVNKCPHKKDKTRSVDAVEGGDVGRQQDGSGGDNGGGGGGGGDDPSNRGGGSGNTNLDLHNNVSCHPPIININTRSNPHQKGQQTPKPMDIAAPEFIEPTNTTQQHGTLGEIELAVGKNTGTPHCRMHDPLLRKDGRWFVHPEQIVGARRRVANNSNNGGIGVRKKEGWGGGIGESAPNDPNKENIENSPNADVTNNVNATPV